MAKSRAQKILDRAKSDPEFRDKIIHLGALADQFIYGDPSIWIRIGPHFLEFARDAGLLEEIHDLNHDDAQRYVDELFAWLTENASELAYYAEGSKKLIPGKRYQESVGKVFLSWTVKNPRDREAMVGIKKALDYFNVDYFDYTQRQLDDSQEQSDQIEG